MAADTQGEHPRDRIARLVARLGEPAVVAGCLAMLGGREAPGDVVDALGGEGAQRLLDRPVNAYWGRVWGARGLLYVAGDGMVPALRVATADGHWRVREMVAKVVARHRLDELAGEVAALRSDPVARVRAAAERALVAVTTRP